MKYEHQIFIKFASGGAAERFYHDHETKMALEDFELLKSNPLVTSLELKRRTVGEWETQSTVAQGQAA